MRKKDKMPKFKVEKAAPTRKYEWNGKQFQEYMVFMKDESGEIVTASMSRMEDKPAPSEGEELIGTIETDPKWGSKFKAEKKAFGAGGGYKQNPETQASIERQNSLTNAISYMQLKVTALIANKEAEKAIKYVTGKQAIIVATHFAKYNKGKVTVVNPTGKEETPPVNNEVPEKDVDETPEAPIRPEDVENM